MAHEEDNIDTSMVAVVGVISAGLSFGLIILLMVLYHTFNNALEDQVVEAPNAEAERVWSEQEAVLNEAAWVDQQKGQVRVPVASAMKFVVAKLAESPEDAGVTPAQFAESDATIMDPGAAAPADESVEGDDQKSSETTASADGSSEEPAAEKSAGSESTPDN